MMWFKTLQFYTQCLGGWRKWGPVQAAVQGDGDGDVYEVEHEGDGLQSPMAPVLKEVVAEAKKNNSSKIVCKALAVRYHPVTPPRFPNTCDQRGAI